MKSLTAGKIIAVASTRTITTGTLEFTGLGPAETSSE